MIMTDLTIIIPCVNDCLRLPKTIEDLMVFGRIYSHYRMQLIFVIDPSRDETSKYLKTMVQSLQSYFGDVIIIENELRIGKGGSITKGAAAADGEWIIIMEANGSTDLVSFLYTATREINNYPFILASRYTEGSLLLPNQPAHRFIQGWTISWLACELLYLHYKDIQSGCKLIHAAVIKQLFPIRETGLSFDLEILLRAKQEGIPIKEVPCIWSYMAGSGTPLSEWIDYIKSIWRLRSRFLIQGDQAMPSAPNMVALIDKGGTIVNE